MSDFNNLKNFCEFIINRQQFFEEYVSEFGLKETRRLFSEVLYNLMLEAGVEEPAADGLSEDLANLYVNNDLAAQYEK